MASPKTLPDNLIRLAANCGIDASGMTLAELRAAYRPDPKYVDQHDMRLQDALKSAEETSPKRRAAQRMVSEVLAQTGAKLPKV